MISYKFVCRLRYLQWIKGGEKKNPMAEIHGGKSGSNFYSWYGV